MSFHNLDYLWECLPAHYRQSAEEDGYFLKRFLSVFGAEMDRVDEEHDSFHLKVAPESAPNEFIEYWLWNWWGWGWFPEWFTPAQRREFYAQIAKHYARRGTKRGIEEFLAAFGVRAKVFDRPQYWGRFVWGADVWTFTAPLVIVVRIYPSAAAVQENLTFWGQFVWGSSHSATPSLVPERADVRELLRFQKPVGQQLIIEEKVAQR